MRTSGRADVWRRVGPNWEHGRILELAFESLAGFEACSIAPYGGLSLVCGVNATGKSRMLASISGALRGLPTGVKVSLDVDEAQPEFVDTSWLISKQEFSLAQDAEIEDRLSQAGLNPWTAKQLGLASYLLGLSYESIESADLDATDDRAALLSLLPEDAALREAMQFSEDVVPYFRVARGGYIFDSPRLSRGELAGLTLIWALQQVKGRNVTILDEPDTYLSPFASGRAFDVIAQFAHQNRSPTVVSSHSHLGLAATPPEHLLLLSFSGQPPTIRVHPGDRQRLWTSLRIAAPKSIVFVVEDVAAGQWLRSLLAQVDFEHVDVSEVWVGKGSGEVRAAAAFPSGCDGATVSIWGVLDGDERGKGRKRGNVLFLPGELSPERIVLEYAKGLGEDIPHVARGKFLEVLHQSAGNDPHDQISAIAMALGLEVGALRDACLRWWCEQTVEGQEALERFRSDLSAVLPPVLRA